MMQNAVLNTLLLISFVQGLDVELRSYSCDHSLPVTADINLKCSQGKRCTFGDVARVFGYGKNHENSKRNRICVLVLKIISSIIPVHYNGVESMGIQNNVAYLSSDLDFFTLEFSLLDMNQVPLCHDTMFARSGNVNECPGDGTYSFDVNYRLPNAGSKSASWLASGWQGTGFIRMYAEPDESMLIGECILRLQTYLTPTGSEKGMVKTPTAAVAAGMGLAVLAVAMIGCVYCFFARKLSEANTKKPTSSSSADQSLDTLYKRMEEEKTIASGGVNANPKKWTTLHSSNRTVASEPIIHRGSVPLM